MGLRCYKTLNVAARNYQTMCVWLTTIPIERILSSCSSKICFLLGTVGPLLLLLLLLFFLYRAPIVCIRCCLVSSALILRGGHPGRSKQQPHSAADSAGLSLPLSPPPLLPHGRHICSPPFYAAVTLLFQERGGGRWEAEKHGRERGRLTLSGCETKMAAETFCLLSLVLVVVSRAEY